MKKLPAGILVFLSLFVAVPFLFTAVSAHAFDHGQCMKNQKAFKGSSAACAREICDWEACKEEHQTTTIRGAIEIKDPGAGDTAIAICKPKEQLMKMCQDRHTPSKKSGARDQKNQGPDIDTFCKPGVYPAGTAQRILNKLNREVKARKALAQKVKDLSKSIKDLDARREPIKAFLKAENRAAEADKDLPKEARAKKWHSGRIQQYRTRKAEYDEMTARRRALYSQYKAVRAQYDEKKEYIEKAGTIYNNRDCQTAADMLGLNIITL